MQRRLWTQVFLLAICLAAVLYARYYLRSYGVIERGAGADQVEPDDIHSTQNDSKGHTPDPLRGG
jgi:hypothetical protein